MKRCRCLSFSRSARQRKQAKPSARRMGRWMVCEKCKGRRSFSGRDVPKPDVARQQGESRLKRWLRKELKRLRSENDAQYPERYDLDITPSCQGYEAALDDFEELLSGRAAWLG